MTCQTVTAPLLDATFLFYFMVVILLVSTANYSSTLLLSRFSSRASRKRFAGALFRRASGSSVLLGLDFLVV